ncbi:hypothetical protein CLIB1444_13S01420 [[Candida] jaroonii]|uniref:Uncharacterized protein n=1 Tax=[Candida] jaroonii TaxID=467808 RepID=A0ACA9YFB9_9ASCO|nr:hypothetical protein CLIB1444_13S01420 [[Candida] jaroonii]
MSKRLKNFQINTIDLHDKQDAWFFKEFINIRKPVKIINSSELILNIEDFKIDNLCEFLKWGDELMVETKTGGGFGNGNKRVKLTLDDLVSKLKNGEDQYYLTTQYEEHAEPSDDESEREDDSEADEDDEYDLDKQFSEDLTPQTEQPVESKEGDEPDSDSDSDFDFENLKDDYQDDDDEEPEEEGDRDDDDDDDEPRHVKELFQPPLTNIYDKIPIQPPFFKNLIPQQINLWMGLTKPKKFDNTKDFPIDKTIPKGTSSGLHHDHSDNLYIVVSGCKRFTLFSPFDAYKLYTVGKIFKIYGNGVIDYEINEFAPDWNHINDDGSLQEEQETKEIKKIIEDLDPPNFSKIPPILLHLNELSETQMDKLVAFSKKNFPDLISLENYKIWLKSGDMLYLPAGWFHEVSSFGKENEDRELENKDNIHIALNYWFAPPNNDEFDKPYKTSFWAKEFENMLR